MNACVMPVQKFADGQKIVTIEGLSEYGDHPVQKAWGESSGLLSVVIASPVRSCRQWLF